MYMDIFPACMLIVSCTYSVHRGQKKALNPLELRFQMTVSHHMPLKEQVFFAAKLPDYHLILSHPTPSIVCMCVFETGFFCIALAVPNQVGFELKRSACLCFPSPGIKAVYHHCWTQLVFLYTPGPCTHG